HTLTITPYFGTKTANFSERWRVCTPETLTVQVGPPHTHTHTQTDRQTDRHTLTVQVWPAVGDVLMNWAEDQDWRGRELLLFQLITHRWTHTTLLCAHTHTHTKGSYAHTRPVYNSKHTLTFTTIDTHTHTHRGLV